eukprot:scaffold83955_cov65-Phaeocystis_antarctica.AAC.1
MGRKSRKSEGPRTTETATTHHQHPPPAPTTTESATAEPAEAGSEEATAHAASPSVAMQSTKDHQHTIGSTSHASAVAEDDSLRSAAESRDASAAESRNVSATESPRGPVFWGWGDGSPRSNQPKGSNATLDNLSSSARVADAGSEDAGSTLKPRPLFPEPVGTDATDGAPPASPTPPSPPIEPPRSSLAGSAAMSPPSPSQAAPPVPATAASAVRSPAARPDPTPLPPLPPLPPPPPPPAPPAAPINPSAEARSSRVKALLRRTAQLAEASSVRSSAPAAAEVQSSPAPWAPSPTPVAAQLPRPPQLPQLPQLSSQEEVAAAAAASADFPLRVVQARLSSLGQLRTRVEGMLGSELAELEGMQALLLHHSRCKASEQAAADAMAAATRLLSGGGAEAERARGVTQIYGALQQYCQASDERLLLEQQSGPMLEPAAASPPPRARCGLTAAGADADAPPPPPTPPAQTASEVEWPPSLDGMVAPALASGGGGGEFGLGASLDAGHGATRHRSEALQALWGEVGALQHSIDAETAELAQAEAELAQPRGGARLRPRGGRAGGDAIRGDADDAFRTPLILRAPPPHDVPPQARALSQGGGGVA